MGVAHVAIQFPLYEAFKAKLAERHHRDPTELPAADLVSPACMQAGRTLYLHIPWSHIAICQSAEARFRYRQHPLSSTVSELAVRPCKEGPAPST